MRCRTWLIILWMAAMAPTGNAAAAEQNAFEKSVIMIRSVKQEHDYVMPWKQKAMSQSIGSGFIIAGNRILTNAHNVSNWKYIELRKENVAKRYSARVEYVGHDCDLAVIKADDPNFFDDTIPLEITGLPKVNSTVSTYGFPVGGTHISVTEGVVSRIETDTYVHTGADSHLVIQTDAAINPGNSGGPVVQDGKVVGVAFQGLRMADNIGYMIPTTVINHFLKDIEDKEYNGFGSVGVILYAGLHSTSYKDYLKVPEDQQGIVVITTLMHSSVETIFKPNDVLTKIDDYDIDNDGMVKIHGLTLHLSEVIEAKQIGETAELTFYRDGERIEKTAAIALNRPIFEYSRLYDIPPRYVCYAGLTFVPATRNFLETWGRDWLSDMPYYLRYLFNNSMQLNTDRQRKEYVILSEILPDEVNSYCGDFKKQVVESINGVTIRSLEDVAKAFEQPKDGHHSLKFAGDNRTLPIDANKAKARQPLILQKYQIPAEARLEGRS